MAATSDGTTTLWLWRRDDLLAAGLRRLTRNLTIEEWQQNLDEPYAKVCDRLPAHESVIRKALELLDEGQLASGRALLEQAVRVDDGEIGEVAREILGKLDRRQPAAPASSVEET